MASNVVNIFPPIHILRRPMMIPLLARPSHALPARSQCFLVYPPTVLRYRSGPTGITQPHGARGYIHRRQPSTMRSTAGGIPQGQPSWTYTRLAKRLPTQAQRTRSSSSSAVDWHLAVCRVLWPPLRTERHPQYAEGQQGAKIRDTPFSSPGSR